MVTVVGAYAKRESLSILRLMDATQEVPCLAGSGTLQGRFSHRAARRLDAGRGGQW